MIGLSIFGLFFLVGLASIAAGIVIAVQASAYPEWAYQQTGTSKFVWQIIPIVLIFVCGLGTLIMYVMWMSKRDEVARAAGSPPPGPPPGLPPQYPGPPQ